MELNPLKLYAKKLVVAVEPSVSLELLARLLLIYNRLYDSHNMIGTCRIKAATIEYKRTRENLLSFMDV